MSADATSAEMRIMLVATSNMLCAGLVHGTVVHWLLALTIGLYHTDFCLAALRRNLLQDVMDYTECNLMCDVP